MIINLLNSIKPVALSAIRAFQDKGFENGTKPLNVEQLATDFGLKITKKDNASMGSIKYDDKDKSFEIVVKPNLTEQENRFVIAHELAHYLLHKDIIREEGFMDIGIHNSDPKLESEANQLAGYICMPMKQVIKKGFGNYTREDLSKEFGIPFDKVIHAIE